MGSFKLIEVIKDNTGKETQSIYDHSDETVLLAAMNNDFGVAVKREEVVSVYCLALNNLNGSRIDKCFFVTPNSVVIDETTGEPVELDTTIRQRVYTHNDYTDDNIAPYDSERLAIGNYHTKKASAMNNPNCNHAVILQIDGRGDYVNACDWTRPE